MVELPVLITYWQTNYALNFIKRQPNTNGRILDTIKYLQELSKLKLGEKWLLTPRS